MGRWPFSVEAAPGSIWEPPAQPANVEGEDWTYSQIIANYDALVAIEPRFTKHRYEDAQNQPILSTAGSHELFHYVYEPPGYEKTIFMQAQIHGNEKDSRLTVYRMFEILFKMRGLEGYRSWRRIYDKCRLIVIPCANPNGNDVGTLTVPYPNTQFGMNPNRNYDFNHQYATTAVGPGGDAPFDVTETQHTRDVVMLYGPENIDLGIDFHDGGGVAQHYWIDYTADAPNRPLINAFVQHLLTKHGVSQQDAIIPNCKDFDITGATSRWLGKTLGVTATTNEWMGGIWGYDFSSAHLTHSLEIRANMLFMACDNDLKGWQVKEAPEATFFHFDYPKAFTRDTLRLPGAGAETLVSDADIYGRWDALAAENPTLITKSASLGLNAHGMNVHTYTFGSGAKKVLYVGGVMRWGGTRLIDEYAIYQLVEYLCNDYIVAQSAFLTDLRNNYTIIVLPFIDNIATNSEILRECGLNNTALSRQRWVIGGDGKTVPATGTHGADNHAVQIIKALVDANTDLKCIVSGGENMEGYAFNPPDYTTTYQTHFVVPRNQTFAHTAYADHLSNNRSELVVVENTKGFTFGDYAFDAYGIPVYFVQLKVSDRFTELAADHDLTEAAYMHGNYEAGRRIANIVNLFVKDAP